MSVEIVRSVPNSVRVSGEIDLSNVDQLSSALNEIVLDSPKGFVLDMSRMTYIDSAGIQAILSAYKKLRPSEGVLALVINNGPVREIFDLLHLEMFPGIAIFDNTSAAEHLFAQA